MESSEGSEVVKKLQQLLNTKGSNESEVMDILGDPTLIKHLMTLTDEQETFLHLAVRHNSQDVLSTLIQLYRQSNLLPNVLRQKNRHHYNPLRSAVVNHHFENTVLLCKECLAVAEDAITTVDPNNSSILHDIAVTNAESNIPMLKFLIGHPCCHPLLLAESSGYRGIANATPLKLAKHNQRQCEQKCKWAKQSAMFGLEKLNLNEFQKKQRIDLAMKFPKQSLQVATEMIAILEMPTTEAKLRQSELKTKENQDGRAKQQKEKLKTTVSQLLQLQRWEDVSEYLLSDNISIRRLSVEAVAEMLNDDSRTKLPMNPKLLAMLKSFMQSPEDDAVIIYASKVLLIASRNDENIQLITNDEMLLSVVLYLLCSLDQELQTTCAAVIANLATKLTDKAQDDKWIQPLLLIKNYSTSSSAQKEAGRALRLLGVGDTPCDPGRWDKRQVAVWMESHSKIEKHSDYRKQFFEADINGLHLLELSPPEMAGLGVKYVSDQRTMSELIDGLRRMKMRSVSKRKDIFLSYAHMNIEFARRIQQALNNTGYTVWIDEAGIRAGHKWRNEIADGIQGCKAMIFIMTARSSNSTYCQDELGLAEEFKKPIINVRVEEISEMDPGLKLIIQRRQWIDFVKRENFSASVCELLKGLESQEIFPTGAENDNNDEATVSIANKLLKLKVDSHTMNASADSEEKVGDDKDILSVKQAEIIEHLKELEERIAAIEKKLSIK